MAVAVSGSKAAITRHFPASHQLFLKAKKEGQAGSNERLFRVMVQRKGRSTTRVLMLQVFVHNSAESLVEYVNVSCIWRLKADQYITRILFDNMLRKSLHMRKQTHNYRETNRLSLKNKTKTRTLKRKGELEQQTTKDKDVDSLNNTSIKKFAFGGTSVRADRQEISAGFKLRPRTRRRSLTHGGDAGFV